MYLGWPPCLTVGTNDCIMVHSLGTLSVRQSKKMIWSSANFLSQLTPNHFCTGVFLPYVKTEFLAKWWILLKLYLKANSCLNWFGFWYIQEEKVISYFFVHDKLLPFLKSLHDPFKWNGRLNLPKTELTKLKKNCSIDITPSLTWFYLSLIQIDTYWTNLANHKILRN